MGTADILMGALKNLSNSTEALYKVGYYAVMANSSTDSAASSNLSELYSMIQEA